MLQVIPLGQMMPAQDAAMMLRGVREIMEQGARVELCPDDQCCLVMGAKEDPFWQMWEDPTTRVHAELADNGS
jgi:hypothetical protein